MRFATAREVRPGRAQQRDQCAVIQMPRGLHARVAGVGEQVEAIAMHAAADPDLKNHVERVSDQTTSTLKRYMS